MSLIENVKVMCKKTRTILKQNIIKIENSQIKRRKIGGTYLLNFSIPPHSLSISSSFVLHYNYLLSFFFYFLQYVFFFLFKREIKRRCVYVSDDGKELEKCRIFFFFFFSIPFFT